jgi:transposase
MLTLPPSVRVFCCNQPTDMRKSLDGLCAMAVEVIQQDPLSGHLFVFRNKSGARLKVLYWGGDGLCLWYKRLEKGTFELPASEAKALEITAAQLAMIIDGVSLSSPRRSRFTFGKAA